MPAWLPPVLAIVVLAVILQGAPKVGAALLALIVLGALVIHERG